MIRNLLIVIFASALMFVAPVTSYARTTVEVIDNDFQNITISMTVSTLHVTGASGQTLYIYNVAGVRVMSIKVDSSDRSYDLSLPKGCYIVKVGKTVRKIYIK